MAEVRGHQLPDAVVATIRRQFRLGALMRARCYFADLDSEPCSGVMHAIHWISRQRIREYLLGQGLDHDLIVLARWDPRNAELSCEGHHARFDATRQPPLRLFREEVPHPVEAFARDWGLTFSLDRDFPPRP